MRWLTSRSGESYEERLHATRRVSPVCGLPVKLTSTSSPRAPRCRLCCKVLGVPQGFGPPPEPRGASPELRAAIKRIRLDAALYLRRFRQRMEAA